ncbi:hypothetical protein [Paraprevotella xylaniphila]|uniref:hypothetical protein n=1 Tax=Paraprevotella xylaniphila TaxID=454155 RepID=UPI003078346C
MEKNRYIKPEVNICELDTKAQILLPVSGSGDLIQSNDPAMPDAEVYSNADMFPDIWDTKF